MRRRSGEFRVTWWDKRKIERELGKQVTRVVAAGDRLVSKPAPPKQVLPPLHDALDAELAGEFYGHLTSLPNTVSADQTLTPGEEHQFTFHYDPATREAGFTFR